MKLAKFEEMREKLLGEAMQQMTEVNGLAKEHAQQVIFSLRPPPPKRNNRQTSVPAC